MAPDINDLEELETIDIEQATPIVVGQLHFALGKQLFQMTGNENNQKDLRPQLDSRNVVLLLPNRQNPLKQAER